MSERSTAREMRLERMQQEDVPEVMAVDRLCFAVPWSATSFRSTIANSVSHCLVGRIGGQLVAYGCTWLIEDEGHVMTLGVDPALRGRGYGEQILAAMLAEAHRRGVRRISLEVRVSNVAAIHLYEKYGFIPVAVRRAYYSNNNEDALVMWIEDMSRPSYGQLLDERLAALGKAAAKG